MTRPVRVVLALVSLGLLGGCASSPSPPAATSATPSATAAPAPATAPAGSATPAPVPYREDNEFKGRVWIAEGFDFKAIQQNDIADLAKQLADLMVRTSRK